MKIHIAVLLVAALAGCVAPPPMRSGVDPDVLKEVPKGGERKAEPRPEAVEQALLPPLRMEMPAVRGQPIDQRFDLSVSNAPAAQVFMSIVSGTRYSMLVHPSITGTISVNLKDVTLREALDSIRDLYGYDYQVDGTRILIQPAGLQTRIFQVSYLLGERRGVSDVRVQSGSVTDIGAGGATTPTAGVGIPSGVIPPAGSAATRGLESSRVTTRTQNDFWAELRTSLSAIVGTGEGRSVVISPQSGLVVIRALPAELRAVENYLRATRLSVERQVMLEAKIIDVELNDTYQSGINWALLHKNIGIGQVGDQTSIGLNQTQSSRGLSVSSTTMSTPQPSVGSAATSSAALLSGNPAAGLFGLALQVQNFAALMQFLETQGKVQVLSSPRVAAINNQKAVLKVGTDEFFVTNIQSATTVATAAGTTVGTPVPTVTVQPFFSGIVLDVTPKIDENNQIILHIHPSVSQVTTDNKDISLGGAGNLRLPLAKSSVSETDTIVRVLDGNIVALGGLMKLDVRDSRGGLPGTGDNAVGNFFRNANTSLVKKELVILLKPTVIQSDREWEEDLSRTRSRFESLNIPVPAAPLPEAKR
ncbi:MAG TPA: secretin N-terminal domain-containing protein [Burkholderiales bacterium]|nr:secretin N-terminal domain-containing protein [Burkholderiales bacterium]